LSFGSGEVSVGVDVDNVISIDDHFLTILVENNKGTFLIDDVRCP
jgi:hypothetical protein